MKKVYISKKLSLLNVNKIMIEKNISVINNVDVADGSFEKLSEYCMTENQAS